MTGVVCNHYDSCLITPQQSFPNIFQNTGNEGFMNCVSYVPCQQGGYIVGNNYNFSDGYSIDTSWNNAHSCLNVNGFNLNHENLNFQGDYNYSNDYNFSEGFNFTQFPNTFEPNQYNFKEYVNEGFDGGLKQNVGYEKECFEQNEAHGLNEGFVGEGKVPGFTPSFFSSNSAFKRIPLQPGRSIFRRRKPGDCASEWSNAFDKDYDDLVFHGKQALFN